jgi:hypothetical protein
VVEPVNANLEPVLEQIEDERIVHRVSARDEVPG